ncbi:MAG: hypothetical protein KC668_13020 [Myxococcales bacterium]|nr:hypothetical protein [Myxococcales bacterium]
MTPKGRLAIAAAEQAGRLLGPRAACSALRSLALTLQDPEDRMSALLSACEAAARLGDEAALLGLTTLLGEVGGASARTSMPRLTKLCARLAHQHRPRLAVALAQAEVQRAPSAEGFYLLGRCLHGVEPGAADEAYRDAEAQPPSERGGDALRAAIRHQRRLLALERRAPAPPGASEPTPAGDRLHALTDAAARLARGGRYARAMAIDQLADLAQDETLDAQERDTALRLVARYADEHAEQLSEVEAERLEVALSTHSVDLVRAFARRRAFRSRPDDDALTDRADPTPAQAIAALLTREAFAQAVVALRALRAEAAGTDARGSDYAAGWLALASSDLEVSREGALLLEALVRQTSCAPHGGFLRMAAALHASHPALSAQLLDRAAEREEPGALSALRALLVEQARRAYGEGDRGAALRALRRADRLAAETAVAAAHTTPHASPAGPGAAHRDDRRPTR